VDTQGAFSTPLLPQQQESSEYGIPEQELGQRQALEARLQQILSQNKLVRPGKSNIARLDSSLLADSQRKGQRTGKSLDKEIMSKDDAAEGEAAGLAMYEQDAPAPAQAPAEEVMAQAAFDRLNIAEIAPEKKKKKESIGKLGRVEDLKLDYRFQSGSADELRNKSSSFNAPLLKKRAARKERIALPEPEIQASSKINEEITPIQSRIRITTFESEIDPFEISILESGHFVLFRKVWRNGQRYIQGLLIEQQPFLQGIINSSFQETNLSQMSDLILAYQGDVFSVFRGNTSTQYISSSEELTGALLYQTRLSSPMSDLELIFSVNRLPSGPGGILITWVAAILLVVLCGGFYLMYRLGVVQINIGRQQQDFVSAVSHELKTPLTSIRMYGEMLKEDWVGEEKKKKYYNFIYDESERLSRLITNVLQLARMTRNDLHVELKSITVSELIEGIQSKLASQVERAGFTLNSHIEDNAAKSIIQVDSDYFMQIFINLIDNAIKFSKKSETKEIDINCQLQRDTNLLLTVRDYGPGIPKKHLKKIFKLFYRSENELTRETVGTGIGLALVNQMVHAMNGKVDICNKEPGAEFRIIFPTKNISA
jgi:signal transduction histidine kinase